MRVSATNRGCGKPEQNRPLHSLNKIAPRLCPYRGANSTLLRENKRACALTRSCSALLANLGAPPAAQPTACSASYSATRSRSKQRLQIKVLLRLQIVDLQHRSPYKPYGFVRSASRYLLACLLREAEQPVGLLSEAEQAAKA